MAELHFFSVSSSPAKSCWTPQQHFSRAPPNYLITPINMHRLQHAHISRFLLTRATFTSKFSLRLSATVGLDDMERGGEIVHDFCSTYFMFHGLDSRKPEHLFQYLPLFMLVEGLVYQFDCQNEKLIRPRLHNDTGNAYCQSQPDLSDPFAACKAILTQKGLMTERLAKELDNGAEYWRLERGICQALSNGSVISIQDVMHAFHLKAFDYRTLDLLLYQAQKIKVNELYFEFLSCSELLGEILDDSFDYEDDVLENSFNIFRMFAVLYGPQDGSYKIANFIKELEEHYTILFNQLEPCLAMQYTQRLEEVLREGRQGLRYAPGTCVIPFLIGNEEEFRARTRLKMVMN